MLLRDDNKDQHNQYYSKFTVIEGKLANEEGKDKGKSSSGNTIYIIIMAVIAALGVGVGLLGFLK